MASTADSLQLCAVRRSHTLICSATRLRPPWPRSPHSCSFAGGDSQERPSAWLQVVERWPWRIFFFIGTSADRNAPLNPALNLCTHLRRPRLTQTHEQSDCAAVLRKILARRPCRLVSGRNQ